MRNYGLVKTQKLVNVVSQEIFNEICIKVCTSTVTPSHGLNPCRLRTQQKIERLCVLQPFKIHTWLGRLNIGLFLMHVSCHQ